MEAEIPKENHESKTLRLRGRSKHREIRVINYMP
jgi:hypothetical protein